jgi:hypothetical protein
MAIDIRSKKGIAIVAGIALVMLALGFGTAYLVSRSAVSAAEERARLAEEQAAVDTTKEPSATVPTIEPTASVEPTTPATDDTTPSDIQDGVFFTFIEKVTVTGGVSYLTADYAQFLTGGEAAAAATAAGDESPPPNDYYIVNENEKLRTLPVASSVNTVILTTFEEHVGTEGYLIGFSEWRDMVNGVINDFPRATMVPYWVTIKGGKVTKIAEQYLP